ncbi:MAG: nucleoside hydrolase [Clostridia bacterium]|nr:nucleoside hydrolase [Clostridia bacterium]
MKQFEKEKIIFDIDPGVDDAAALALSLYDDIMDIVLVSTVSGNRDISTVTRNALHILELFRRTDIPVAIGASKALKRISEDAAEVHKFDGLGGYIPPEVVETQPIGMDAVEAMYQAIKKYKGNISIIAVGPHTNVAMLILKHPEVKDMVKHIYTEGCSPYGWAKQGNWTNYISFNARTDPEALEIVCNSGIPVSLVFSRMGREMVHLTEKDALKIRDINSVGEWLYEMYDGYWEHGYKDKRIAINDTCACLMMRAPKLFRTKKVSIKVNTTDMPGKTEFEIVKDSNIELAVAVDRYNLHRFFKKAIKKLDFIDISADVNRSKKLRALRFGGVEE